MRRILFLLAAGVALAAGAARADSPVVGDAAPDFTLPSSTGAPVSLASFRGKYVALEWTNPECPFVGKHYNSGNMQHLQKDATAHGVVWLTIDSSAPGNAGNVTPAQAAQFVRDRKADPTAFLLDGNGQVGHLYGARTTPHMFLIGPKGTVLYEGGIDSIASTNTEDVAQATPYFRNAVDRALAGQSIDPATTRPYGCSIKY